VLDAGEWPAEGEATGRAAVVRLSPVRSRLAWAMAIYFGTQSLQAYVAFGWFGKFFRDAGLSGATAGLVVAFLSALSIPTSMLVPRLAARMGSQRPLVVGLGACYLVGYLGMLAAPLGGAWVWAFFIGVGASAFPLALTMIGLYTRTPEATAAMSSFSQGVGYLVAGVGPLLVGVLHGATGGWAWPFALMFLALAVQVASGWYVAGLGAHQRESAATAPGAACTT
jgi:MFS transporter, CP family, cyanate transporter